MTGCVLVALLDGERSMLGHCASSYNILRLGLQKPIALHIMLWVRGSLQ